MFGRFGGEGEGGHTHMLLPWKSGDTFQFFVQKQPGTIRDTTDTRYYFREGNQAKWRHAATISSPNGGKSSVATIGGGLNSFLENFAGKDKDVPKLALYRLWLGFERGHAPTSHTRRRGRHLGPITRLIFPCGRCPGATCQSLSGTGGQVWTPLFRW